MTGNRVDAFVACVAAEIARHCRHSEQYAHEFPSIAAKAVAEGIALEPITGSDVLTWVLEADELPVQARLDETFGQPPVTLYNDGSFQIDALFWVESSTDIHGHGFSGAFLVLDGRSVHTQFEFVERRRVDAHFSLGRVNAAAAELLDVGDVRLIRPGAELIHSVVHLGHPSVTLVARTCAQTTSEYAYFPPAVALEPSRTSPWRARVVQLMRMLIRSRSNELAHRVEDLIGRCDIHTAFMVVRELSRSRSTSPLILQALESCDRRWPGVGQPFGEAVTADVRHSSAVKLLNRVTDPHHRIVLGALAALDDPQLIRTFLKSAVAVEIGALIADFVNEMQATGVIAIANGDPYDHVLLRPLAEGPS